NQQFGPLTMRENCNPNRWTWVDDPWPWEMEA
ncbi:spore coat protein CotJB, partial [uncultured Anaerotruncus sp.]